MAGSKVPPEAVERLRNVVEDWGREVTGAQNRLQEQIRAAASELSQIESLLLRRLGRGDEVDLLGELESLRLENQALREALEERDQRIQELTQLLSTQTR